MPHRRATLEIIEPAITTTVRGVVTHTWVEARPNDPMYYVMRRSHPPVQHVGVTACRETFGVSSIPFSTAVDARLHMHSILLRDLIHQ